MSASAAAKGTTGAGRWLLIAALAVAINAGFALLMEEMIARDRVRVLGAVRAEPIEFARTSFDEETRSKDRRRKPPPKPQEMKRQVTRMEQTMTSALDLPMPDAAFNVSNLLDLGGGVGLGQHLVQGEGGGMDISQVGVNDLVPMVVLPPQYPPRALMRRIQGYVVVSFVVDTRGLVSSVDVIEAEPPGYFEDAARSAVERWRFRPHTRDGEPVPALVTTRIMFDERLQEGQR
jgi:protein TonB